MDKVRNKANGIRPIFIFSLPRSGSTLLQRILSVHPLVASTPEPWLLLPFFYALRKEDVYAEYMHQGVAHGVRDFIDRLPDGIHDYHDAIQGMAMQLYACASDPNAVYFIDKTPRYSLIANEIIQAFPDAKFIFLWRNPLAVAASMIESWGDGRWNLYDYYIDLFPGLEGLCDAYQCCPAKSMMSLKYEDLVQNTVQEIQQICAFLEIEFIESMASDLPVEIAQLGDVSGIMKYRNTVSDKSCDKWMDTVCNLARKIWFRRYCSQIGQNRFEIMGYQESVILEQLREVHTSKKFLFLDSVRMLWGWIVRFVPMRLFKESLNKAQQGGW